MKEQKKAIAIDFDGVIFPYSNGWSGGKLYDSPTSDCIKALKCLREYKIEIIIFTVESRIKMKKQIKKWIAYHFGEDFEYTITNKKPMEVLAIVDDRAIRFENNWSSIIKYLV